MSILALFQTSETLKRLYKSIFMWRILTRHYLVGNRSFFNHFLIEAPSTSAMDNSFISDLGYFKVLLNECRWSMYKIVGFESGLCKVPEINRIC